MKKDKQTKKQNKKEEVKKVTKTMGGQIPSLSKEEKRLEAEADSARRVC